jgi:hypothetical protein
VTRLIEALEALKMRTDLAIIALRRGDKAAAVREIDVAVDELRDAVSDDENTEPDPTRLEAAGPGSDTEGR